MALDIKNYEPALMYGAAISDAGETVTGTLSVSSTSTLTGAVSMGSTLAVTGASTLTGAVTLPTPVTRTGEQTATVTSKTLAATDCGVVQVVATDAQTLTLPATVVGMTYVVRNGGTADGAVGITVAPNASDKIMGNGFTATDNKAAINTKATAKVGDELVLVGDGVDGWFVQRVVGTWARAA